MFRRLGSVDLRSLALLRIVLGSLLLLDLILRSRDLRAFYCDAGVLPRIVYLPLISDTSNSFPSLHLSVGTLTGELLLFSLAAIAAVALLFGWHTRSASILSWFLVASVQIRNPYVTDVGDQELRLMLFWAMFLPLGARWSYDARRNPRWRELPNDYASIASLGYFVQLAAAYLMAALLKNHEVWRSSGEALYYTFQIDQFATAIAHTLLGYPELLRTLTFAGLTIEFAIPLLILLPWGVHITRPLALLLLLALQLGIGATLHLGIIVPISIAMAIPLIPGSLWNRWERSLSGSTPEHLAEPLPTSYRLHAAWLLPLIGVQLSLVLSCAGVMLEGKSSEPLHQIAYWTRTQQSWALFAPYPFLDDGWFLVEGKRADGALVDLLRDGAAIGYSKPDNVAATFRNQRWRVFLQRLAKESRLAPVIVSYLKWEGQEWNLHHFGPEAVSSVRLIFVEEVTPPPGSPPAYRTRVLGEHVLYQTVLKQISATIDP